MLCSTCGEKVQFKDGTFICKNCDSEYDMLDIDVNLIPEPIFVSTKLHSQYAVIDTRKQKTYLRVNTVQKAKLTTSLLNQHISQNLIKRYLVNYLNHK